MEARKETWTSNRSYKTTSLAVKQLIQTHMDSISLKQKWLENQGRKPLRVKSCAGGEHVGRLSRGRAPGHQSPGWQRARGLGFREVFSSGDGQGPGSCVDCVWARRPQTGKRSKEPPGSQVPCRTPSSFGVRGGGRACQANGRFLSQFCSLASTIHSGDRVLIVSCWDLSLTSNKGN